jgi:hypothetical protein
MKKLIILVILALIFIFQSCSFEDEKSYEEKRKVEQQKRNIKINNFLEEIDRDRSILTTLYDMEYQYTLSLQNKYVKNEIIFTGFISNVYRLNTSYFIEIKSILENIKFILHCNYKDANYILENSEYYPEILGPEIIIFARVDEILPSSVISTENRQTFVLNDEQKILIKGICFDLKLL